MKTFFKYFILLLLYSYSSLSQEQKVLANAKYKLTHHYDTLNYDNVQYENYISIIYANEIVFKSLDKELQDSAIMLNYRKTGVMAPVNNEKYNDEILFLNFEKKEMFTTSSKLIGDYLIERTFPSVSWNLNSEKKLIIGYKCQKATTNFKGRNYIAWFTEEIPLKAGLGKFNGLPGLIVLLEDEAKRIKYELNFFKTSGSLIAKDNKKRQLINWDKYENLVRFLMDDPYGFLAQRLGRKIDSKNPPKPMTRNPLLPKKSITYPLEPLEFYIVK
jgi:GLPGLI family protein